MAMKLKSPTFGDLGITQNITNSLLRLGIRAPTEIQKSLIPAILAHQSIMLKDITGSGKTFGIVVAALAKKHPSPIPRKLSSIDPSSQHTLLCDPNESILVPNISSEFIDRRLRKKYISTIILVPSRTLALQITDWILEISAKKTQTPNLVQTVISGIDISVQKTLLGEHTPSILVGTPQRLFELIEAEVVDFSRLQMLVVDEVDRVVDGKARYTTFHKRILATKHELVGEKILKLVLKSRDASHAAQIVKLQQKKTSIKRELGSLKYDPESIIDSAKAKKLQVVYCSATLNSGMRGALMKGFGVSKDYARIEGGTPNSRPIIRHLGFVVCADGDLANILPIPFRKDGEEPLDDIVTDVETHPDTITAQQEMETKDSLQNTNQKYEAQKQLGKSMTSAFADDSPQMLTALLTLIQTMNVKTAFVFVHSSISIRNFVLKLKEHDIDAKSLTDLIHASPADSAADAGTAFAKQIVLNGIIVANEFDARGLDMAGTTHVFVLGLPSSPVSYTHMSGRVSRICATPIEESDAQGDIKVPNVGMCVTVLPGERYVTKYQNMVRLMRVEIQPYEGHIDIEV